MCRVRGYLAPASRRIAGGRTSGSESLTQSITSVPARTLADAAVDEMTLSVAHQLQVQPRVQMRPLPESCLLAGRRIGIWVWPNTPNTLGRPFCSSFSSQPSQVEKGSRRSHASLPTERKDRASRSLSEVFLRIKKKKKRIFLSTRGQEPNCDLQKPEKSRPRT